MKKIHWAIRFIQNFKAIDPDKCWLWKGDRNSKNYGLIQVGRTSQIASRMSYEFFFGEFDKKLFVMHKCNNPPCVNPNHLELGNYSLNTKYSVKSGTHNNGSKKKCLNGHPFTKENTYFYETNYKPTGKSIHRRCRKCDAIKRRVK